MPQISKGSRILVTGAHGFVGRHLVKHLKEKFTHVTGLSRSDTNLEDADATHKLFQEVKPEFVFHLAGKVGGIKANIENPATFLVSNTLMAINTLTAASQHKVKKFLFTSSSCVYPRACPQPMQESSILTGPLEPTNESYALAKLAGMRLVHDLRQQKLLEAISVIPSNIFGPGDSFDLQNSHVLSALVRRFAEAKKQNAPSVTLWGSGKARRELTHVTDIARGLVFLMEKYDAEEPINLGCGEDHSVLEMAELIAKKIAYTGKIQFDTSQPEGMPRKCMDVTRLNRLGFTTQVDFATGVDSVIKDFQQRQGEFT